MEVAYLRKLCSDRRARNGSAPPAPRFRCFPCLETASRRSLQKHFCSYCIDVSVFLIFRSQHPGETEWRSIEQRVPILWTACHLGGGRPWFRCTVYSNGQYCGRRVAVLYGAGDLLRYGLSYVSQQESPQSRFHQALANDQNAARWQSRRATALSEKAAWNAPAHVHAPSGA